MLLCIGFFSKFGSRVHSSAALLSVLDREQWLFISCQSLATVVCLGHVQFVSCCSWPHCKPREHFEQGQHECFSSILRALHSVASQTRAAGAMLVVCIMLVAWCMLHGACCPSVSLHLRWGGGDMPLAERCTRLPHQVRKLDTRCGCHSSAPSLPCIECEPVAAIARCSMHCCRSVQHALPYDATHLVQHACCHHSVYYASYVNRAL